MIPPLSFVPLGLKLALARLALTLERLVSAGAWLILWVGVFVALAWWGITLPWLPYLFWLGAIALLSLAWKKFFWPTSSEAARYLEVRNERRHRPASGIDDLPAHILDTNGRVLWKEELARKQRDQAKLRPVLPSFSLIQRDPLALRVTLVLLLFSGYIYAGGSIADRSYALFIPDAFLQPLSPHDSGIKITVTPPSYTRRPPLTITGKIDSQLEIAAGSEIRVMVKSGIGGLVLKTGATGRQRLSRDGNTSVYLTTTRIEDDRVDNITLSQWGWPRLSFAVRVIRDRPPVIVLREPPKQGHGGQIRLPLKVSDDYGLKLIRLRAIPSPDRRQLPLGTPVHEEQPVIAYSEMGAEIEMNPTFDLTGHPWAGEKLTLLIEGEDFAGQSGQTEPFEMVLPERNFRHPVAKKLIELRKAYIHEGLSLTIPTSLALQGILERPDLYGFDTLVTLALRSTASRLIYNSASREIAESVIATLWMTSLRLEDGNLTNALADLRKALDQLRQAVQDKKSPEEIADLLENYRLALANYLQKLQGELQKRMDSGEAIAIDPAAVETMLDLSSLGDMLRQMQDEMMNGDYESALEKLEKLQSLSEMMNPSLAQPLPENLRQQMEVFANLQKIIDRQQTLLDQTRAADSGQKQDKAKAGQDKIREDLGKIEKDGKESGLTLPDNIPRAHESMARSSESMAKGDGPGSIPHQQAALDALREGQEQMRQALKQEMRNIFGLSALPMMPNGKGGSGMRNGRDLFGEDVKIPGKGAARKNEEILKIIRERAGDLSRPQTEREYYQRLLRQW